MDAVQDVCGDFQQILDDLVGETINCHILVVDVSEQSCILVVSLALEFLIGVNLVTFGVNEPRIGFFAHKEFILVFDVGKAIGVFEDSSIVKIVELFHEEKLNILWILLRIKVVEFHVHFGLS